MVRWAPVVQFCARVSRGKRRLTGWGTEQSQELSQRGCNSQAHALCLLPYPNTQNGFRVRSFVWQKQSAIPSAWPPAHGAWVLTCPFPPDPTGLIFLPPRPGPSGGSVSQDGACLMEARCQSQGQSA